MTKTKSTISSLILITAILVVAWLAPLQWGFLIVMVLMLFFCLLLGVVICGEPLGVLISDQNVISLSRFQTVIWTIIIMSALLVIAMARIKNGVIAGDDSAELADPLNIVFGKDLLGLLGITATSLVGSPLIAATKRRKIPAPHVAEETARNLIDLNNVPNSLVTSAPAAGLTNAAGLGHVASAIEQHSEGLLYQNPRARDASFTDMFEGDELGNAAYVDLSKVQMFFFTVTVAVAYVVGLLDILSTEAIYGANFTFPAVSTGMVGVLGISNVGYLAAKSVDHTQKS